MQQPNREPKWVTIIPKRAFAPENGAMMEPMPSGPYIMRPQGSEFTKGTTWQEALTKARPNEFIFKIPAYFLANTIYANVEGIATAVAYHYDTSD